MSYMMEPVTFERDVNVILIPDGYEITVREGARGYITQVLGGNYTVQLATGRLVRVSRRDGDAIGQMADLSEEPVTEAPAGPLDLEMVWERLSECYDPEIPVNIVDLGLIYDVQLDTEASEGPRIDVLMTLTAPGCGMGQVLKDDVEATVRAIPGVKQVDVELTFDPPWSAERMSEAARLELGMF